VKFWYIELVLNDYLIKLNSGRILYYCNKRSMTLDVEEGECVLLISPVSVPQQEHQRIQDRVKSGKVQYVRHCDLSVSGYPSSSFDSIVAIGGSVDHTKQFFAKISSLLKPSGKFFLTEPIAQSGQPKVGIFAISNMFGISRSRHEIPGFGFSNVY
jgi:hypothetical protein